MKPGLDLRVGNNLNGSEIRLCPGALWSEKSPGRDRLIDFDKNMGKTTKSPIKNYSTGKECNVLMLCTLLNNICVYVHEDEGNNHIIRLML